MAWFGKLIGTDAAIENITNAETGLLVKGGTALSNLYYSDQEKAESDERTREWGIRVLDSLAPFKVVQRLLAFASMFTWVFVVINLVLAIWIKALYPQIDAYIMLKEIAFSDFVFYPVMSIFVLYTGGGTINSFKGGK